MSQMKNQKSRLITVVGLGVRDGDLSLRGAGAIDSADTVVVKTALTDTYRFFTEENIQHITCDDAYESAQDFDDLDERIVAKILSCEGQNVVYCVDGNGVDDRSVILLQSRTEVNIIAGVSRELTPLRARPAISYVVVSSYDIAEDKCFNYDKSLPLIVKEMDNIFIAGEVKEILSRVVGEEQEIILFRIKGGEIVENAMQVYELDRKDDFDYSCGVYIAPIPLTMRKEHDYIDLYRIMLRLRGRNGCEWDKAQTHASIRKNVIEEAYELVDAIDNDDINNIIEESGDVILQGVFHTVIGEDVGEFTANEVLTTLCNKLITRHTHIFGDVIANNAEEALKAWENAKAKEKNTATFADTLMRISRALPSGIRAYKAQRIASKMGMDFANIEDMYAKLSEEIAEFKGATAEQREMEAGDLLFSVINILRYYSIDSETALNKSVNKFINRIAYVEQKVIEQGLKDATLAELDIFWDEAKALEKKHRSNEEIFNYASIEDIGDDDDEYSDDDDGDGSDEDSKY